MIIIKTEEIKVYTFNLFARKMLAFLFLTSIHLTEAWTVKVVNETDKKITVNIKSSQKYLSSKIEQKKCQFTAQEVGPNSSRDFNYKDISSVCQVACTRAVNVIKPVKVSAKNNLTSCSNVIAYVRQDESGKWKIEYQDWTDEAAKLVEERKKMPLAVRKMFDKFGDSPIQSISVFRAPIQAGVNELITNLTQKQLKTLKYDELYHSGFIITCQNTLIRLERNATVSNMIIKPGDIEDLEQRTVVLPQPTTYKEFIIKAMENDPDFWKYDPVTRNCQLFTLQCLEKNNIEVSDDLYEFIYQDAAQVLSESPKLRGFAEGVTSLANRLDYLIEKTEQKARKLKPKK